MAISAVDSAGGLAFYPLADFSPELVAIRWARRHGVPVVACDLSVGARWPRADDPSPSSEGADGDGALAADGTGDGEAAGLLDALLRKTGSRDTGQLWERLVESPAIMATPEAVRTMALLFGWAVRGSSRRVIPRDRVREAAMRQCIRRCPPHIAAVVGSFHAGALLPEVVERTAEADARLVESLAITPESMGATKSVGVSLVPYSFAQLDERSGYPAGIRDPVWHQRMVEADGPAQMDAAAVEIVVALCRRLRRRGHVAGTPDATEIIRMMRDLARLRHLVAPGRSELIEAIESCLVQGELHGRARQVARAAEEVLVGQRSGQVCSRTPRCGLAVWIEDLLAGLGLPTRDSAGDQARELRLDVLRSPRDRARAVALRQLNAAGIPYATRIDSVQQGQRENLAERWRIDWQSGTSATIEAVSRFGVTLPQVVEGILRRAAQGPGDVDAAHDEVPPAVFLQRLEVAAQCGLHHLVHESLEELNGAFLKTAGLSELVGAATVLGRIRAGHVPALPSDSAHQYPPVVRVFQLTAWRARVASLLRTSLDRLDGFEGSDSAEDVMGLADLVQWFSSDLRMLVDSDEDSSEPFIDAGNDRLVSWCRRTLGRGSDRMRGAAAGVLGTLEQLSAEEFAALLGGWYDSAVDAAARRRLRGRLAGAAQILLPWMQADPQWLSGLEERLSASRDDEFLKRLPALRGAFHEFSPADRARLLELRLEPYQERGIGPSQADQEMGDGDPLERIAWRRSADLEGRRAVESLLPEYPLEGAPLPEPADAPQSQVETSLAPELRTADSRHADDVPMADRWRMILGVPPRSQQPGCRAAAALDELYGAGQGEGARGGLANRRRSGSGGGTEAPQPTTVEWSEELEQLFGSDVCQEVLGEAAGQGRSGAIELLDPDAVTPSVELLKQVLFLAGGLPEGRAERLRKLARRITEALVRELAIRLRPALSGLSTPRPTRRHSRRLNLSRTIRANLANVYRRPGGQPALIAKRLVFNAPARREMDWHLTFVVDVSGSMTASVVYSALCAAVFAELPALTVRFLAFSTEVIDLSGHVVDPLTLLLEVQVGGGTHIGLGLRAARSGITVPSRSIVVLVSDFEEGVSVGEMVSEVRMLAASGVRCVGLAALDDSGTARFHQGYAQMVASAGMPVAAVSPERLASWVGDQIRNRSGEATAAPPGTVAS